jgi:hypothetical protein
MRSFVLMVAAAASLLAAPAARALEPFTPFDTFNEGTTLDPARWVDAERVREIKGGGLHLMQRTWGLADGDVGVTPVNWNANLTNPAAITQMRARIKVLAIEANTCPSNPAVADARARIVGGFFNVGTPVPGSQVGDAIAQVRLLRASNSADAPGVLRVQGLLNICTTVDCAGAFTVGNIVDLGTVAVGTATTVQMQWDKAGKTFTFSRDGGAWAGTVAYSQSDASPPSVLFRQLSTRVNVPSCQAAPRVSGLVDARFDNVLVNRAAAP